MIIVKRFLYILLGIVFLASACTNDATQEKKINTEELLTGRWELRQAIRNNKPAPTMEGTYFDFSTDKSLTTNMMGSDETSTFALQENQVIADNGGLKTTYHIDKITSDSLVLLTTIRGFNFDMTFMKKQE